jgi:hypothetical protein
VSQKAGVFDYALAAAIAVFFALGIMSSAGVWGGETATHEGEHELTTAAESHEGTPETGGSHGSPPEPAHEKANAEPAAHEVPSAEPAPHAVPSAAPPPHAASAHPTSPAEDPTAPFEHQ